MHAPAVTVVYLLLLQGIKDHMRYRNLTGKKMQLDNTYVIVKWGYNRCLPTGSPAVFKQMNQRRLKVTDASR